MNTQKPQGFITTPHAEYQMQGNTKPSTATEKEFFVLPPTGEALLTPKQFQSVLGLRSQSTLWDWAKKDPNFPPAIRRGERFTRYRLSDVRQYINLLSKTPGAPAPAAPVELASSQ